MAHNVRTSVMTAALVCALGASPALAHTTVVSQLGEAPLLGSSSSTAQMRANVARNEGVLSAAATKLGLTSNQYALFRAELASSRVSWVTVPRHLDAMTWQGNGRVYALHDVMIPANTRGWEVDLPDGNGRVLALYMPALCGNLSILRKSAPLVAHHAPPTRVAALAATPPAPPPPVEAAPAPVAPAPPAPPVPNDQAPAPPATVAQAAFPPVAAAAAHGGLLPLLVPLLAGVAALSGGSGSGPVVAPPVGCP
jgi:hypothetical protein